MSFFGTPEFHQYGDPTENIGGLGGNDNRDPNGGVPSLPDMGPASSAPAVADAGNPDGTRRQAVGPDGYYLDQGGNPTGGRPMTVEEQSFQNTYPNGGSFSNPLAAQTQDYNTQVANGGNPSSRPLSIEEQAFQHAYPNGGTFASGDPNLGRQAAVPTLPDMGQGQGGGPAAMAAGQGWYVDAHGRFVSDNMGANARANTVFDHNPSIGAGTIIDTGTGGRSAHNPSPFDALTTGQDYTNAGRALPGNLGLTNGPIPTLADMHGGQQAGAPGALGGGGGGFGNYNPQLGSSPQQTYGRPTLPDMGQGAGAGGGQPLSDVQRIKHDANGTTYVTDPTGYMAPGGQWSTKDEILRNVFDPGAREKLQVLARLGDKDAQTVLSGLGPDIGKSQGQQDWIGLHNPIVQRTGVGDLVNPLANPVADATAFAPEYQLIDAMKKDGVNVSGQLVNGNIAYLDTNGDTKYIPGWRAGQLLQERATKG